MLHLKHDIQIHVKNENEVFRLIRLLFFTFVLFNIAYEVPNYIWNIPLYWVSVNLAPWVVAIPAMIAVVCRKKSSGLFGKNIIRQFFVGALIGCGMAAVVCVVFYSAGVFHVTQVTKTNWKHVLYTIGNNYLSVGPAEEMIYRVGIMECMMEAFPQKKWLVALTSNFIFAFAHLKYRGVFTAGMAFCVGVVYTMLYWRWDKCRYVMVSSIHATYDFSLIWIGYFAGRMFA